MRYAGAILLAVAVAAPAHAESVAIDAPAGRAGDAAVAIARQTGTSIVITDQAVSNRRIPRDPGQVFGQERGQEAGQGRRRQGDPGRPDGLAAGRRAREGAQARRPGRETRLPGPRGQAAASPRRARTSSSSARSATSLLADYPGEVEMIDGEDLTFGGAGGTEKITQRIPTVSSTHLGSGRNKLFIRGIADSSFTGPTQSTVGQYFGDLRLSYNAPDPDLRLTDLRRVEILEGPQGTLYGAGALGGILRMVPNPPEMGVVGGTAMVGGSATQHGAFGGDASATINLPVAGTAALRVTIDAETRGGYIDKPRPEGGERQPHRCPRRAGSVPLRGRQRLDFRRDGDRPDHRRARQPVCRPQRPAADPGGGGRGRVRRRLRAGTGGDLAGIRRHPLQELDRGDLAGARGAL